MTPIQKALLYITMLSAFTVPCVAAADEAQPGASQEQAELRPMFVYPDYIIGPGDVLDISVWKDEALTRTVVVLPDGTISFPLIGEMKAAGKTLAELKLEAEEKLKRYVQDLVLSVEVKQLNSLVVYVLGRVNSPGRFTYNSNITVMQALAMAGGFNPFAGKNKVKIFRQEGDKTRIIPFRYSDVAEGDRPEENIRLNRGDVIVVP